MQTRRSLLVGLGCLALMLAGCSTKPGKKVVTYSEQTTELPKPLKVTQPGNYGLYPDDGLTAIETIALQPGDVIGFRHAGDGSIVGFAGSREFKLTAVLATDYSWKFMGAGGDGK